MSGKHLSIEPAFEIEPGAWPRPADHPYPAALDARTSPAKSFVVPILCLLALGSALVSLLASRPEAPISLIGLFAIFVIAASLCAGGLWRARQITGKNEPLIEISARGLSCPGLFAKTVPWSEIYDVRRAGAFVRSSAGGPPGIRIWVRDQNRFEPKGPKTILGMDAGGPRLDYVPLPTLLDVSQRQLYRAIQAHRAHLGRGGHPIPPAAGRAAAA
jgi:hypothetical protein